MPEGSLIGASSADITERKRVEEELRKSKERLEEAQRTAQIGDWEYDILAGKVTWSDEMYRIRGVDPERYVPTAKSDEEFCHPDDVPLSAEHSSVSLPAASHSTWTTGL